MNQHTDRIDINNFTLPCTLGTTPLERSTPQEITINLKLFLSLQKAGQADDLSKTVDYAALIGFLEIFLKTHRFNLIEALAEQATKVILKEFPLDAVEIQVSKKPFTNPQSIPVTLFRKKE